MKWIKWIVCIAVILVVMTIPVLAQNREAQILNQYQVLCTQEKEATKIVLHSFYIFAGDCEPIAIIIYHARSYTKSLCQISRAITLQIIFFEFRGDHFSSIIFITASVSSFVNSFICFSSICSSSPLIVFFNAAISLSATLRSRSLP